MWLTPASTACLSTASACSRSRGGPNTPGPGSCIAPNPIRRTGRPASRTVVSLICDLSCSLTPTVSFHHIQRLYGRVASGGNDDGDGLAVPDAAEVHQLDQSPPVRPWSCGGRRAELVPDLGAGTRREHDRLRALRHQVPGAERRHQLCL